MITHLRKKASLWGAFFILGQVLYCPAATAEQTRVRHVIDGDSLQLVDGRKVRLVGINAPELGWDERPDQPLARKAKTALEGLIGTKPVSLSYGPDRFDHYGRTLAYVGTTAAGSAGEYLLRDGLAVMVAIPPNLQHIPRYQKAEAEARAARRGVWAESYFDPVPAKKLNAGDTGFRIVTGTIQRVGQSRKYVYLDLTKDFAVVIDRNNWHYFGSDQKRFTGRKVQVRGWVSLWRDKLRMRIGHPAMMESVEK